MEDIPRFSSTGLPDLAQGLEQGEILHIPGPDLQDIHLVQVLQLAGSVISVMVGSPASWPASVSMEMPAWPSPWKE